MLSINDLAKYINIDDIPNDWIKYYNIAKLSFNNSLFKKLDIEEIINYYEFDKEFKAKIKEIWNMVNNDINLAFLVYLWYYILYEIDIDKRDKWSTSPTSFKDNGSSYMPILSMLMGYKKHKSKMINYDLEQIKIQKQIIRDICVLDKKIYNFNGVRFSSIQWASRFMRGEIIQIGILQYEYKKEYLDGKDIIFIHIPRNCDFTKENIDYTFQNRNKVFSYFNVSNNIYFICKSWLLSKELIDILNAKSNILYFQKYFDIVNMEENKNDFIKFIFNKPFGVNDYNSLVEDTSLQKSIKNKLLNGEKLHIGIGFLK